MLIKYILALLSLIYSLSSYAHVGFRISWCSAQVPDKLAENYFALKSVVERRTTLVFPKNILLNACQPGKADIWWFDFASFYSFNLTDIQTHILNGGVFIVEGDMKDNINLLNNETIGLTLVTPEKNGMFYRSFYLLQSLDGCSPDTSKVLMLRKKANAQAPVGLFTKTNFLSSGRIDCFQDNMDYKIRSFINIMFAFMTTDYKEDQSDLPEILDRIKKLGLEP
ncbi:MAG: hypothetical protein V4591_07045 [Bdellovibrionota bacterium]